MRDGRNATRRNRNIGTAKSGRGQNNQLVIPSSRRDVNAFWGRIGKYRTVRRLVHGNEFAILVESTRRDSVHACTVDDLFKILPLIPARDLAGINFLLLRQPKRKEEIVAPCWGRLAYLVEIDDFSGATIILEAIDPERPVRWSKTLSPEGSAELERLRDDGHPIVTTKREHVIELSIESVRATQLYRTLLHEVGHWVDYVESVERPADSSVDPGAAWTCFSQRYDSKPKVEKESFAHGYATQLRNKLAEQKRVPFARMLDSRSLRRDGLKEDDFVLKTRNRSTSD